MQGQYACYMLINPACDIGVLFMQVIQNDSGDEAAHHVFLAGAKELKKLMAAGWELLHWVKLH